MKLEPNMYVRTESGEIHKITNIIPFYENGELIYEQQYLYLDNNNIGCKIWLFQDYILKASHNIKKLIGVGDIISYEFPTGLGMIGYENVTVLPELLEVLQNGENNHEYIIKSIVTKEMFESMSYKVGE